MNIEDQKRALRYLIFRSIFPDDERSEPPGLGNPTVRTTRFHLLRKWCEGGIGADAAFDTELDFRAFAAVHEIDTNSDYWLLDAVIQAAVENPSIRAAEVSKNVGRPRIEGTILKDAIVHEFLVRADQLKALLQTQRGEEISDMELAREMAIREGNIPRRNEERSYLDDDRFEKRAGSNAEKISRSRKSYRSLLEKRNGKLPLGIRKIPLIHFKGQAKTTEYKWAPSSTELDGCPGWKQEYRKIRKKMYGVSSRPRSTSRKP